MSRFLANNKEGQEEAGDTAAFEPLPSGLKTELPSGSDCDLFADDPSDDDDDNLRGVSNVVYRQECAHACRLTLDPCRASILLLRMCLAWEERVQSELSSIGIE